MTNYNDGNWHGWNGGECPVHPESVIACAYRDERKTIQTEAGKFPWMGHPDDIPVAFRVIKEHREPREWWAVGQVLCATEIEAEDFRRRLMAENPSLIWPPTIHVREVIE